MNSGIRWRLSAMMFLQYVIWGAWSPVLSAYLEKIGFSGVESGWIYALLPLGCMIAPFAGGQLADRYVAPENVPAVMTLAQAAEIGTMLALPWMLGKWGVRKTLAFGIIAWPIRYAIFAVGQPKGLVIAALTLHGICYVCFFVVCFIYVNSVATADIRASAQAFITFVVLGVGMFLGSIFAGWIRDYFTVGGTAAAPIVDYRSVFLVPCALTVVCALVFLVAFREKAPAPAEAFTAGD
jgi:MFS family permease